MHGEQRITFAILTAESSGRYGSRTCEFLLAAVVVARFRLSQERGARLQVCALPSTIEWAIATLTHQSPAHHRSLMNERENLETTRGLCPGLSWIIRNS